MNLKKERYNKFYCIKCFKLIEESFHVTDDEWECVERMDPICDLCNMYNVLEKYYNKKFGDKNKNTKN